MAVADWKKSSSAVNLSGAFYLSQAALGHMLERGTGRIVNVSSIIGEQPATSGRPTTPPSKSGLFGLTKTLAKEAAFMLQKAGKLRTTRSASPCNTCDARFRGDRDDRHRPGEGDRRGSPPRSRCGGLPGRRRSPGWCTSWPPTLSGYITGQVWGVNGGMDM